MRRGGMGILKIGKPLGIGTGTVQRIVMEQPRLSTSTSLKRRLPLGETPSVTPAPDGLTVTGKATKISQRSEIRLKIGTLLNTVAVSSFKGNAVSRVD